MRQESLTQNQCFPTVDELIELLPLKSSWVDDVVAVLLSRFKGEAHVREVTKRVVELRTERGEARVQTAEETVTRSINDHCVNNVDAIQTTRPKFFIRTNPATYMLIGWPNPPRLWEESRRISFTDYAYKSLWSEFCERAKDLTGDFPDFDRHRKLSGFVRTIAKNDPWLSYLEDHGCRTECYKSFNNDDEPRMGV